MKPNNRKRYTPKHLCKRYDFVNSVATILAKSSKVHVTEDEYPSPCKGYRGCCFYSTEYECKECQLANYIYELTRKRRKNMQETDSEKILIEKIVDRAKKLKVLKMDREVAIAFMELAAKHYDLSLSRMLEGRTLILCTISCICRSIFIKKRVRLTINSYLGFLNKA